MITNAAKTKMYIVSIPHYPLFVKWGFAVDCKRSVKGLLPKKIPVSAHTGNRNIYVLRTFISIHKIFVNEVFYRTLRNRLVGLSDVR